MLSSYLRRAALAAPYGFCRIAGDRRAVTAIEYALIAMIIVTAMLGGLPFIGRHLAGTFNSVASEL